MDNPFQTIIEKLDRIEERFDNLSTSEKIERPILIAEAAEYTGKSVASIYALCSRDKIPYHKKGKRLYFFKSDLLQWIRSSWSRKDLQRIATNEIYNSK